MKWGWVWTDHGRPLPVDDVFARHLAGVKQRLGGMEARIGQRRRRLERDGERPILHVRDATATRIYRNAEVPEE